MSRFPFRIAGDRATTRALTRSTLDPIRGVSSPAGYAAPAQLQIRRHEQLARLSRMVGLVRSDPHLMRRLSDRVYALWQADQRVERDRITR